MRRYLFLCVLTLPLWMADAQSAAAAAGDHQERAVHDKHHSNDAEESDDDIEEGLNSNTLYLRDRLTFDIPIAGNTVSLQLERNPRISSSLPIYLGTSEYSHIQLDSRKVADFSVYQDLEKKASFLLWSMNNTGDRLNQNGIRGIFEANGEFYLVESVKNNGMIMSDNMEIGVSNQVTVNGMRMALNKVDNTLPNDIARVVNQTLSAGVGRTWQVDGNSTHDGLRRSKRSFHNYEVELFLIIDYSIFKKWEKMSKRFYYDQRETDAIDNIRFYFAHVLNGMDLRYRTIREYDFEITLRPVGVYIAKTREASYWTEFYPFKEDGIFVEGYRALDALEDWINSDKNKLPYFDQVTLFTAYSLFSHYTGGTRHLFYGITDIEGICGPLRAAICRDKGYFSSVQTAAHELGHSLGAYHDGTHGCSSKDQYIMAVSPGQVNERTIKNVLRFSSCSIADFRRFLYRLTRLGQNCLLHRNNSYVDYSYQYIYEKPGQRYSPDEQCKNIFGLYSFYCGGGQNDAKICVTMQCWDPGSGRCVSGIEQRAAEGTSCGSKKWCVLGQCEYDSRAAYFNSDSCIYGDYKGFIFESRGRYTCSSIKPHKCYLQDKREMCCQTCRRLKIGPVGCEYGDREPDYCRAEVERQHCYDANIRSKCCKFCKQLERPNAPPGCEYGDKQRFCETIHAYNCYQSAWMCCETCHNMELNLPGCKYGDRVSWCQYYDNKPYMCYESTVQSTCCNMCRRAATGPPGCEWGDRFPSCSLEDCKSYSRREKCCRTCSSVSLALSYKTSTCKDKASWCRTMHPSNCYRSGERRTCCRTCEQYHTGPSNCPYGDRFSWCDPRKHCKRPQERSDCCRSCA